MVSFTSWRLGHATCLLFLAPDVVAGCTVRQHSSVTVLLAGLAAIVFGLGDILGGVAIQRANRLGAPIAIATIATFVGALILGGVVLVRPPETVRLEDVLWPIGAGTMAAITRPLLYLGMARGPVAVFAPGYGLTMIVVPAILGPFIGQGLQTVEVIGLLLAVPAVVFLSGEGKLPKFGEFVRSPVIGLALIVGTSLGMTGIFLTQAAPEAGDLPAFLVLATGAVILPLAACRQSSNLWPERLVRRYGLVLGCFTGTAFLLSTAAYLRGSAAVVTALVALCPGISVLVSWRFLGERLYPLQALGGFFGTIAVVCFSMAT
ncbi:MAG TPA: hypothetical protein DGF10_04775 [Acidimicrobiaceae bacterium]|nr:hypothetical protein [Acidimicrobiaceae bacterium]